MFGRAVTKMEEGMNMGVGIVGCYCFFLFALISGFRIRVVFYGLFSFYDALALPPPPPGRTAPCSFLFFSDVLINPDCSVLELSLLNYGFYHFSYFTELRACLLFLSSFLFANAEACWG
jgi:hypothetical protein